MASAIPSSAGVYHWASVTGGAKYGRVIGFFAGWYVHYSCDSTPTAADMKQLQLPSRDNQMLT